MVGNGGSRRIPEGHDRIGVEAEFVEVLRIIGNEAAKYGITVALEPLNTRETDFINSVPEAVAIAKTAALPQVRVLADFYHMRMDEEPMEALLDAKGLLAHVHIANSHGRIFPADVGEDLYDAFFGMLGRIGYNERISLEATAKDLAQEAPAALAVLREAAARANAAK